MGPPAAGDELALFLNPLGSKDPRGLSRLSFEAGNRSGAGDLVHWRSAEDGGIKGINPGSQRYACNNTPGLALGGFGKETWVLLSRALNWPVSVGSVGFHRRGVLVSTGDIFISSYTRFRVPRSARATC